MDNTGSPTRTERGIWFKRQIGPEESAYNNAVAVDLEGRLEIEGLFGAARALVQRHAPLRTLYEAGPDGPVARTLPQGNPDLRRVDARGWPDERLQARVIDLCREGFDPAAAAAFRMCVFARGEVAWTIAVVADHLATDLHALEIIGRDLDRLYRAGTAPDGGPALPALRPFLDYRDNERAYLASPEFLSSRDRWLSRLTNPPAPLVWPRPHAAARDRADCAFFEVEADVVGALRRLAVEAKSTIYPVVLAAWATVLAQVTGSHDLVVGTPVSLRDGSFEDTVGCFVNLLPMRMTLAPEDSARDRIGRARTAFLEALAHRRVPFSEIVGALRVRERRARADIQAMLTLQTARDPDGLLVAYLSDRGGADGGRWLGCRVRPRQVPMPGQAELVLELFDTGAGFRGALRTGTDSGIGQQLDDLAERFRQHLRSWATAPEAALPARNAADGPDAVGPTARALGHLPGATVLPGAAEGDLVARVDRMARQLGGKVALIDGERPVTYTELQAASRAVATACRLHGVQPGEPIGVAIPPSRAAVAAMLGVMRAGGAYLPLDPRAPPRRLARIAQATGLRRVLAVPDADLSAVADYADVLEIGAALATPPDLSGDEAAERHLAYMTYTSGSSGEPKVIAIAHAGVCAMLDASCAEIGPRQDDVWMWFHAASFDLSVWEIWGALTTGGTLAICPEEARGQARELADSLARNQVSLLLQTPSALRLLADEFDRRGGPDVALRSVLSCGEALPGGLARRILDRSLPLWNLYGPAEATVFTTARSVRSADTDHEIVPIGAPLGHARVYLIGPDLTPTAPGTVGEICIGGRGVAEGYANRPDLTRERFLPDPFGGSGRLYRTGDFGYDDGDGLRFVGRQDDQIKLNGHRVELGDVEAALRAFEAVADAAAVMHARRGHQSLGAAIVPRDPSAPPSAPALRRHLLNHLPSYMIPGRIVSVAALPLNAHGKTDRRAVAALVAAGRQDREPRPAAPPLTGLEGRILEIWHDVLGHRTAEHDQAFFDVGGDSFTLMAVYARLGEIDACHGLKPVDLLRYPTVASLAKRMAEGPGAARDTAPARRRAEGAERTTRRRAVRQRSAPT